MPSSWNAEHTFGTRPRTIPGDRVNARLLTPTVTCCASAPISAPVSRPETGSTAAADAGCRERMAGGSSPNDEAIHARAADRTASRGDSTGMNATTRFRTELLAALDPRFEALGFLRRKEAFAWSRQVSAEQARS